MALLRFLLPVLLLSGSIYLPVAPNMFPYEPEISPITTPSPDPLNVYGLANMHRWPELQAELQSGAQREPVVIAMLGDSWVLDDHISGPLRTALQDKYGDAGAGYVSLHPQHTPPPGVEFSRTGEWTDVDALPSAVGVDIAHSTATAIDASATITANVSIFAIHYLVQPGGGTFQSQIDDENLGPWKTDYGQTTRYFAVEAILPVDGQHTFHIKAADLGTAGVTVMGFDCQRYRTGIRVHKLGNDGLTAGQIASVELYSWHYGLAVLGPDVVVLLVGTEDDALDTPPDEFAASVSTLIARVRASKPASDIIVVTPGDNGLEPGVYPIQTYVTALRTIAQDEHITFYDILGRLGSYDKALASGYYASPTQLSAAGGAVVAQDLLNLILQEE